MARQIDGLAWVTTTTHLGTDQLGLADRHFSLAPNSVLEFDLFKKQKITLISGPFTPDNRVLGPSPDILEKLREYADNEGISLFIEADGSRSKPVKAPAEHEPVIPGWIKCVIVVAGLSALGKPFTPQWVHRPEYFSKITHLKEGDPISIDSISDLLIHPEGGLKGIPPQAKKIALLNQADTTNIKTQAKNAVMKLLDGGFDRVVIGSVGKTPQMLECYQKKSGLG